MVKTVTIYKKLYFFQEKSKKQEKESGTNFVLLCQSKNMFGHFKKAICIDQSRFYIFSHPQEFKNV